MTIIEAIRNWIRLCPLLDDEYRVNVDYLPETANEYTIDNVPGESVIQRYIDGTAKKQALFVFASHNIDNSGFYEDFSSWVEAQNDTNNLPTLDGSKTPIKVEVLTSAYVFQADAETARYQIQCRLIYMEV